MDNTEKKTHSDMQELANVLDTVGDKIPGLIQKVMGSLYSRETATGMGQAVGAYYRELVDAGIPQEAALDMATEFSFSLKDMKHGAMSFSTDKE